MISRILAQEDVNFLFTNRLPRRAATRFMGWFSKIEQPWVRHLSLALWRFFADVDLSDARDTRFRSLHEAFIRPIRAGARRFDERADVLASPCDAIVGACGRMTDDLVHQIKGFPYRLSDLLGDAAADLAPLLNGTYVTLRLTAGMYHRFHAPHDLRVESVTYISGDTWNVNPIALKRVERLFCRNERAVIRACLTGTGLPILIVPVAAILVASIRLCFLDTADVLRSGGPRTIRCDAGLYKGEEMGWFEHGSTILLFAPSRFVVCDEIVEGARIRAGQPLLRL